MSGWTYQAFCLFIVVDVDFLVEGAKPIDLAGKGSLLELSVGYGDVALFGIEEPSGTRVSTVNPSSEGIILELGTRHVHKGSLIIDSVNSIMLARPTGLFKRPCASQSLLTELNAESFYVTCLLMGLPAVSLCILALLLIPFLLLKDGGGLEGAASSPFLLEYRLSGNDLGDDDGSFFSVSAW